MQPRWYQHEAEQAAWEFLCSQRGSPVIVSPTGSGKSLLIAMLCRTAIEKSHRRVIMAMHRKELIQQNAEKIRALIPSLDVGIYSAGMKSRDTDHDIVCCGIQSAFRRAEEFGARHLVLIDEVHLVPSDGEGMYRTFLTDLRKYNPELRMIGLTATPFRTGEGKLCGSDKLFQKICYDVPIKRLIDEGFLCSVTNKPTQTNFDTSGLHIRGGEFINHEVERLFSFDQQTVEAACREIVSLTQGRHSVLVFCSGVEHAENVAEIIQSVTGERAGCVTGETMPIERTTLLSDFKNQRLRFLTNCDVLTTGFDAPCIDAIAILRATASAGLFAQMVGRGFRVDASKTDCVLLDFGENLQRHGPIDDPMFGRKEKQRGSGGMEGGLVKTCPNCNEQVPAAATECECGWQFPRKLKHKEKADQESALLAEAQEPEEWIVEEIHMSRHRKKKATPDDPDTLRVDYVCVPVEGSGNLARQTISEWVCLEHEGFPRKKALRWWAQRSRSAVSDIDDAIDLWQRGAIATPERITTKREGKFFRIVGYQLDERPETWSEEAVDFDFEPIEVGF